jgi:uncharacterized protein
MKQFAVALSGLLAASLVNAASFDCAKASTKVEHMICDNQDISKLDEELAQSYKTTLQNQSNIESIKQAQKQWMKERNACDFVDCIKSKYKLRLSILKNMSANPLELTNKDRNISSALTYEIVNRKNLNESTEKEEENTDEESVEHNKFCEVILDKLNGSRPTEGKLPCISNEILNLPNVKDPAWQKLDLSQHEELVKKIMTLSIVGVQEYFRKKKLMPNKYPTLEQQQRGLENAKSGGAELYRLSLSKEYFGERVLVVLRYTSKWCGVPSDIAGEESTAAWVNPDMKEIASDPGLFDSYAGRPIMYHDKLYLMRTFSNGAGAEIYIPKHEYISLICEIQYSINDSKSGDK